MQSHVEPLISQILDEVRQHIIVEENSAYILDPLYGIVRNRVNAEICKTLVRMGEHSMAEKIITSLIHHQNNDGSWNEIHPQYNQPSALITAFAGDALLSAYDTCPVEKSLRMARDYVLSQEITPGRFLKSSQYTADHLNVDASCGAFLANYGARFSDECSLEAAERAALRVCGHQNGGVYPYAVDKGNYPQTLDVPCIHYQAVTMYYLLKINEFLKSETVKESLLKGAEWLSSVQKSDGQFDWSRSGLMFAYYLGGAPAFAYSSFLGVASWDPQYLNNAGLCLNKLEKNVKGLILRWEPDSMASLPPSIFTTLKTAQIGDYPLNHRVFSFGYGMYRQWARRRFSDTIDDRLFHFLCRSLHIQASTVEPSRNYPDMFMTSEILDCLSYSMERGAF